MSENTGVGDLKRRAELKSTGYTGSTFTQDWMAIGPCDHVDSNLVSLFAETVQLLYAAVSAARTLPPADDSEKNAVQQILVASAAIAATEAEALVSLSSVDLSAPAQIHARALGDIVRRFLLLPGHPNVALKMFESLEASRRELVKKIPEGHPARASMEPLFAEVTSDTMQKIEQNAYDKDDQSGGIFMGAYESKSLSKWNHADIVALADAGDRLLEAGERVRTFLVVGQNADLVLHRGLGSVLGILYVMAELFGVQIRERLDELVVRHATFVERFRAETETLKQRMAEATQQAGRTT